MSVSAFKNNRIPILIVLLSGLLAASIVFFLDLFYRHAARAVVDSWHQSEAISLQQGNVLSAITKLQRGISTASFLKGVQVFDKEGHELIRIGDPFPILTPDNIRINSIQESRVGIFQSQFTITTDQVLIFVSMSSFLLRSVSLGVILYFVSIFLGGVLIHRKFLVQQQKFETEAKMKLMNERLDVATKIASMGKQVAHDIRSPLMAIEIALRDSSGLTPDRRALLEQASARIRLIAEELLTSSRFKFNHGKSSDSNLETYLDNVGLSEFLVGMCVDRIVNEKMITHPHISFELEGVNLAIKGLGIESDFERVLSNILQNATEAVDGSTSPRVRISLRSHKNKVQIIVSDNGKGMAQEVVNKLGEEGFTYGKPHGNGLGLAFARRKLNEWSGALQIISKEGHGTIVNVILSAPASSA